MTTSSLWPALAAIVPYILKWIESKMNPPTLTVVAPPTRQVSTLAIPVPTGGVAAVSDAVMVGEQIALRELELRNSPEMIAAKVAAEEQAQKDAVNLALQKGDLAAIEKDLA